MNTYNGQYLDWSEHISGLSGSVGSNNNIPGSNTCYGYTNFVYSN